MIRRMAEEDVEAAGQVWLTASLAAHDFVPASFWQADHKTMVSEILPAAHGYVHETAVAIDGFVALGSGDRANFMGALFVGPDHQSRGIGTRLLDHVKAMRDPLDTSVYKQNHRAFAFYQARGFRVTGEAICEHTGCGEYTLRWTGNPEPATATDGADATAE